MQIKQSIKIDKIFIEHLYKYLGIGVINTIVGYGLIFSLMFFGLNPFVSNFIGYLIGIFVSYYLNKRFNFRSKKSYKDTLPKFFASLFIAYLANLIVLTIAIKSLLINKYISQIIAGVVYVGIGFLGSKYFAFSDTAVKR